MVHKIKKRDNEALRIIEKIGLEKGMNREEIYEILDEVYDNDYTLEIAGEIRDNEKITDEQWEETRVQDYVWDKAMNKTVKKQSEMADRIMKVLR